MYEWIFPVIWGALRALGHIFAVAGLILLAGLLAVLIHRVHERLLDIALDDEV